MRLYPDNQYLFFIRTVAVTVQNYSTRAILLMFQLVNWNR